VNVGDGLLNCGNAEEMKVQSRANEEASAQEAEEEKYTEDGYVA
jgi:hypothetical protein